MKLKWMKNAPSKKGLISDFKKKIICTSRSRCFISIPIWLYSTCWSFDQENEKLIKTQKFCNHGFNHSILHWGSYYNFLFGHFVIFLEVSIGKLKTPKDTTGKMFVSCSTAYQ